MQISLRDERRQGENKGEGKTRAKAKQGRRQNKGEGKSRSLWDDKKEAKAGPPILDEG
jgi:hypothetical protein